MGPDTALHGREAGGEMVGRGSRVGLRCTAVSPFRLYALCREFLDVSNVHPHQSKHICMNIASEGTPSVRLYLGGVQAWESELEERVRLLCSLLLPPFSVFRLLWCTN